MAPSHHSALRTTFRTCRSVGRAIAWPSIIFVTHTYTLISLFALQSLFDTLDGLCTVVTRTSTVIRPSPRFRTLIIMRPSILVRPPPSLPLAPSVDCCEVTGRPIERCAADLLWPDVLLVDHELEVNRSDSLHDVVDEVLCPRLAADRDQDAL